MLYHVVNISTETTPACAYPYHVARKISNSIGALKTHVLPEDSMELKKYLAGELGNIEPM